MRGATAAIGSPPGAVRRSVQRRQVGCMRSTLAHVPRGDRRRSRTVTAGGSPSDAIASCSVEPELRAFLDELYERGRANDAAQPPRDARMLNVAPDVGELL